MTCEGSGAVLKPGVDTLERQQARLDASCDEISKAAK